MGDPLNKSWNLSVGIVGAGIAGLASAVSLRRAGHHVELFEQTHFKSEIGAAITITPNGTRVLEHWGVDSDVRAVKGQGIQIVHHETLQPIYKDNFEHVHLQYGSGIYHWHRVELHRTLRELATSPSPLVDQPAKFSLGHRVSAIDCDEGTILLDNGDEVKKDLIVIADGHKSRFNQHFNPSSHHLPLIKNGRSIFRTLIPFSAIQSHPTVSKIFSSNPLGFFVPMNLASHTSMVTYQCRTQSDELMLNIALVGNSRPQDHDKDNWHSPSSIDDALTVIHDFAPALHDLVRLAPEVKVYTTAQREPLPQLSRGRAVILGDAAAIMMPDHAQGGTIALEQAAALGVLFTHTTPDDVPERTKDFDALMRKHTHIVQKLSNSASRDAKQAIKDEVLAMMAETKGGDGGFRGRTPPGPQSLHFGEEVREFFYPYDVFAETARYLEMKNATKRE